MTGRQNSMISLSWSDNNVSLPCVQAEISRINGELRKSRRTSSISGSRSIDASNAGAGESGTVGVELISVNYI